MSKYLLELGTEELPYRFIPMAAEQLQRGFENFFNNNKINFEKIDVYATPRRLAVIVSGLDAESKDEEKIVKGPLKTAAYDENGNLTPAGAGFCKKNNVEPSDLFVQDNYLHARIVIKAVSMVDLLKSNVPLIVSKLQGPHFMRWADNEEKFSRPVRWVVSILDREEVKIKIIDKVSSNISRGHRFAQQKVVIGHPDDYVETMRNACVIVDQNERRQLIIDKTKSEAAKIGAEPYYTDDLPEEVTFLTEYPAPVICEFDPKYLDLPEEVTVTVMAVHQRYFALYKDGKLINKFITMTNYIGDEFENIKAGNLRVIKARLDDAVFFYNENTKKPLADYVEDLKGITFQKGMGSMYDKTQRLIELSRYIADGESLPLVQRTALLAKADLTTSLVFEFTELQGVIGADYARVSGEDERVVMGIKEHYFPLNAESETAGGIEGQIAGIADKIDNICAVFADGKKPTGSSDPLGVRRAALGIIRTVIDRSLKLNIYKLIEKSLELLPVKKDVSAEVSEFFVQRLIIFLEGTYKRNVLEACASNPLADLNDYLERVKVVSGITNKQLLESANRVSKLLKEEINVTVNTSLFKEDAESMLYEKISGIHKHADYKRYLAELEMVNPVVVKFFEDVLVMDQDEKVKNNRLALLEMLKEKYGYLADFSKL
ncbi:MAG: glycine--tRNA ligase subunit beta [Heliobacteriaceae bacterium]|nr:glycine--tRNA ligase subunit beta [Heliobacteriaceae bacterium]